MTITELKEILTTIEDKGHGDNDVTIIVTDWYSTHGEYGDFLFDADVTSSGIWTGIYSSGHQTALTVSLKSKDGKQPKITFRKQ